MATVKTILESNEFEIRCAFCGYKEHPICLTAHHIFPKYYFKPQPVFDRIYRYLVLCPTCHSLLHRGVFVGDGKKIIMDIIRHCEQKYSKFKNIDNIIKLALLVYKTAYTTGDTKHL